MTDAENKNPDHQSDSVLKESLNQPTPAEPSAHSHQRKQDEKVSEIIGERVCASCGFNLFAQPILREHHYNMLIVRCPECGTVAAIQEYPILGKWANRWSKLLAAFWLIVIFGGLILSAVLISALVNNVANESVQPFASAIGKLFEPYRLQHPELYGKDSQYERWFDGDVNYVTDRDYIYSYVDRSWWEDIAKQSQANPLQNVTYDWVAVFQPRIFYLSLILIGIAWSVVMIGASRKMLLAALLIIGLLAWAAIMAAIDLDMSANYYWWSGNITMAQNIALEFKGPTIRPLLITVMLFPLAIGMLFGRPIVRFLVITLYPPRMRGWLAFLWIEDGKTPPKKTWLDR